MKYKFFFPHKNILPFLASVFICSALVAQNRYKKTSYKYDLISGKVNEVIYQKDNPDEYIQKYGYDADNRITEVRTSTDGVIWDRDAGYSYYPHGPLSRVELGDNKVQCMDYAYTLQGWTKGVNSNALNENFDIGKDGISPPMGGAGGGHVARDVYGFSLSYYRNNTSRDYTPIGGNSDFLAGTDGSPLDAANSSLYNGNIRHMVTSIRQINGSILPIHGNVYRYDQLNRLKAAETFTLSGTSTWNSASESYKENFDYDANGNISLLKRNGNNGPQGMDDLSYIYASVDGQKINNRLLHVDDEVSPGTYTNDIDDQGTFSAKDKSSWNYQYDEIGNLISDKQEEIEKIEWDASGKIKSIHRITNSTKPDLEFKYDAMGNRIARIVKPYNQLNNPAAWTTTHYIQDAQGTTLAIYEKTHNGISDVMMLKEQYMYGSQRIGSITRNLDVTNPIAPLPITTFTRTLGRKNYELSNHLGNVLATISDNRTQRRDDNSNGTIDYFSANVLSSTDYYAFGSPMPGRDFGPGNYRFGFNGMERDNEVVENGNSYDFEFRIYTPRLGRFLSTDPLVKDYPWNSTYAFAENRPIDGRDLEGKEWENFMSRFTKPGNLKLKLPNEQTAQKQHYSVTVQNPSKSFADFKKEFKQAPQNILTNSKAEFNAPVDAEGKPSQFKEGSYIKIAISGPMNDSYVAVQSIEESKDGSLSVTFATLEGHVEKGIINFKLSQDDKGNTKFDINSTSEVDFGLVPNSFARNEQMKSWKEVLNNVVNSVGGKEVAREVKVTEGKKITISDKLKDFKRSYLEAKGRMGVR